MLTSLSIENFKCFSTRQHVELAPLTLLIGPNGSGKSAILHAILYLHELVTHGNADVDRTTLDRASLAGSFVELGGFGRLVHRHEGHRAIVLRAEFTTPRSLERAGCDLDRFPFPDLDDDIRSAWLELTVRARTTPAFRGAVVDRAVIGVNGSPLPLVWLETGASLGEGEPILARVNLGHPLLAGAGLEVAEAWRALAVPEHGLPPCRARDTDDLDDEAPYDTIARAHLGLPDDHPLPVFALSCARRGALPPSYTPLHVLPPGGTFDPATAHEIRTFLEMVVLGTTAQLACTLRATLHVGSLRAVPPRGLLDERPRGATCEAAGLGAWERLLDDPANLVERTNAWLDRLGTHDRVVVQRLFDPTATAEALSIRHVDRTARRLLVETQAGAMVLPSEASASLSQVLPVVVAALDAPTGLVEQPESHVHPAHHGVLGDLFVTAAARDGGRHTLLVETHSEALVRRVLQCARAANDDERPVDQVSVLHVEPGPQGVCVQRLPLGDGEGLSDRWVAAPRSNGAARPSSATSWAPSPA